MAPYPAATQVLSITAVWLELCAGLIIRVVGVAMVLFKCGLKQEENMQNIIRLGDKLTSGGQVLTASTGMNFMGLDAARVGDQVSCPLPGHGVNQIVEGDTAFVASGQPIALQGHCCACGCALTSSLPEAGRQ